MSDIYSTAQAAQVLGISADTIRTWKRRQTELLLEKIHWFKVKRFTTLTLWSLSYG